jgi:DNA-directed RNA polymerase subunit RPC12/RpoP
MALIKCSECGKEISDKAKECPHCGNPINYRENVTIPQEVNVVSAPNKEGCFLQTMNLGCIVVIIIVVIITLFVIIGGLAN